MALTSGPTAWSAIINKAFTYNKKIKSGRPKVLVYSATPNAAVTASVGTLCWDVGGEDAYICTAAPSTWVKINA